MKRAVMVVNFAVVNEDELKHERFVQIKQKNV